LHHSVVCLTDESLEGRNRFKTLPMNAVGFESKLYLASHKNPDCIWLVLEYRI